MWRRCDPRWHRERTFDWLFLPKGIGEQMVEFTRIVAGKDRASDVMCEVLRTAGGAASQHLRGLLATSFHRKLDV